MNPMILVWAPVYNEAPYIAAMIDSVLAQSFTDFTLLISDNHSTDGTHEILTEYARRDSRIQVTQPEVHCPSLEHYRWMFDEVIGAGFGQRYSIFIGGHDIWHFDYLRSLLGVAEANPASAIVYGRCDEIDLGGRIINRYYGYVTVVEQPRAIIPISVLSSLTHNILAYGLWREGLRRSISMRYICTAVDHLLIAEMALLGGVIQAPEALMFLRRMPGHGDGAVYKRKHLGDAAPDPNRDFAQQLDWVLQLVDKAIEGDSFYTQPPVRQMLRTATVSTYISRYLNSVAVNEEGLNLVINQPDFQRLLGLHAHYDMAASAYIAANLGINP
jgi:hypothetical protein